MLQAETIFLVFRQLKKVTECNTQEIWRESASESEKRRVVYRSFPPGQIKTQSCPLPSGEFLGWQTLQRQPPAGGRRLRLQVMTDASTHDFKKLRYTPCITPKFGRPPKQSRSVS